MYENVLPRGALDESISLRPVEPLHCSLLSHGKTPFSIVKNCSPEFPVCCPGEPERPLKKDGGTWLSPLVPSKSPQSKRLLGSAPHKRRRELPEPWTSDADFYDPTQDVNLPDRLITRHSPPMSTRDNKRY